MLLQHKVARGRRSARTASVGRRRRACVAATQSQRGATTRRPPLMTTTGSARSSRRASASPRTAITSAGAPSASVPRGASPSSAPASEVPLASASAGESPASPQEPELLDVDAGRYLRHADVRAVQQPAAELVKPRGDVRAAARGHLQDVQRRDHLDLALDESSSISSVAPHGACASSSTPPASARRTPSGPCACAVTRSRRHVRFVDDRPHLRHCQQRPLRDAGFERDLDHRRPALRQAPHGGPRLAGRAYVQRDRRPPHRSRDNRPARTRSAPP